MNIKVFDVDDVRPSIKAPEGRGACRDLPRRPRAVHEHQGKQSKKKPILGQSHRPLPKRQLNEKAEILSPEFRFTLWIVRSRSKLPFRNFWIWKGTCTPFTAW